MRAMSAAAVRTLDIERAVTEESASSRNLVPETPGWDKIDNHRKELDEWLKGQLQRGYTPAPQTIINVRKIGFGVRPVPALDPADRVLYRALTNRVLQSAPPVVRDTATYLNFIMAPVRAARATDKATAPPVVKQEDGRPKFNFASYLGSHTYSHVVQSDIVSFYQYIDHGILGSELSNLSSEQEIIGGLLDFLLDVQGREHGLPQLLDASDSLSEVYIQVLVRAMSRHGFPAWNFSDDLRVLCKSYEDSRSAIELLSQLASELGLTINEEKTATPRFVTYFLDASSATEDNELREEASPDAEANVSDYTETFEDMQTAEAALEVLASATVADKRTSKTRPHISLRKPSREDLRSIRKALARLTSLEDDRGLEHVSRIFPFVAAATPTVVRYLAALCAKPRLLKKVASTFDTLTATKLSPWQEQWLVHLARTTPLLVRKRVPRPGARIAWVQSVLRDSTTAPATRAEAAFALSLTGDVDRNVLNSQLATGPSSLRCYYLCAAGVLSNSATDPNVRKELQALAGSSPYEKWLVESG